MSLLLLLLGFLPLALIGLMYVVHDKFCRLGPISNEVVIWFVFSPWFVFLFTETSCARLAVF